MATHIPSAGPMTITAADLLIWLAIAGPALIAIGVLAEYVWHAVHYGHRKGH